MALDLTLPDWLQKKCSLWIERLNMGEWDVGIRLALVVMNDEDTKGSVEAYPDINLGRIQIRADVEDNEDWEVTLVHELLHIKHARIDDVIQRVFEPHTAVPTELVDSIYRRALEPYIDSLSKALVAMARAE